MMAKTPGRAMLSRLVDAYDRISEESLGMGDPESLNSMRSKTNSSTPSSIPAIEP
jgi:hypothetical protein